VLVIFASFDWKTGISTEEKKKDRNRESKRRKARRQEKRIKIQKKAGREKNIKLLVEMRHDV
jgi:hypothetical protein